MKVTFEVDCTPDEARQFLGLPDVKPMQANLMAKMEAQMTEAAARFSPDAMLKSWMNFVPQTPDQLKAMLGGLFRSPSGPTPGTSSTSGKDIV